MDDTGAPVSLDNLFGAILRSFRKSGLRETAAKVPINFSHLAKWERGERQVPEEMIPALDRVYAANGTLITLHELIKRDRLRTATAALWDQPLPAPPTHQALHRAARRMFAAISAATGTPTPALQALEAADELAEGLWTAIEQRDGVRLADWDRLAHDHALACHTHRPGALLAQLTLDHAHICHLLHRHLTSVTTQLGLLRTTARLATLLAGQWADLGRQDLAERYWHQARASADSSGDRELRVRVRAQRAHAAYWTGRPSLEVARLVDEALRLGDDTPRPGLALAYAAGALLAAERGDADGVHAALGEFDAITGHLSPGPADDQALPADELPAWACACHRAWPYLRVGDIPAAAPALAEADKLCPPDFPGPITTLRLYRAHLLIVEGDIDHGLELALSAVQSWPLTIAHRQVLTRLLAALPAQAHLHPAAQTLHHLLPRS